MKISDKKLKKAHALYEAGKYEDALKACEKVLKKEYHNEDALTIEGNSLYKLGRLEEAIINWKTNAEFNNNSEAKEFLSNIDNEVKHKALNFDTIVGTKCDVAEIRAEIQRELAASTMNDEDDLLKELEEKAKLRKEKEESPSLEEISVTSTDEEEEPEVIEEVKETIIEDLSPNLNEPVIETAKENDYDEIIEKIEEEPSNLDNENKTLGEIRAEEMIRDIPEAKPKKNLKVPIIAACGVCVLIAGAVAFSNFKGNSSPAPDSNKTNQETTVPVHNQKLVDDLNLASSNKNFGDLSAILSSTPKDKVASEDMDAYNKAYEIMATEGVDKLYHAGLDKFKAKDYNGALTDFNAALPYSKDNYLRPHLLYFTGTTNANLNDLPKGLEYYKMLLQEFPHSDMYTPEVLYKLAEYYNSTGDKDQAKDYAKQIENKYPSSIYYNDVTKDILYK
ncbi:tetratricopeptide repeat protein [Clostridium sp. LY3-2]|uniref:tetratricopeptide repeat protein n=1 Tax=Clostridium sp. LY3-2 TaxID=2942482 RepID=UPI0021534E2E|nr:tetratricopeptide repeat protein [Clostridium sp. LY3-2]MCR6514113.1 tetratricopeptide repeat protein [Clostridium sp. LY3-2]